MGTRRKRRGKSLRVSAVLEAVRLLPVVAVTVTSANSTILALLGIWRRSARRRDTSVLQVHRQRPKFLDQTARDLYLHHRAGNIKPSGKAKHGISEWQEAECRIDRCPG